MSERRCRLRVWPMPSPATKLFSRRTNLRRPASRCGFERRISEESLGNATLRVFDRVFPPHPDPLPPGEETGGVCLVFSPWSLGKLQLGCDREAVDHSQSHPSWSLPNDHGLNTKQTPP